MRTIRQQHLPAAAGTARCRVGVVGLGYAGLPQAVAFASAGHPVVGVEVDEAVVHALRAGRSPVDTVTDEQVARLGGLFTATVESSALAGCSAVLVCVPTPLDGAGVPDLGPLCTATASVAETLRPGQLVVIESTVYPGVTQDVVRPLLERSALRAGEDFHLAFAPERVDPGNGLFGPANTPRVIGGLTPVCALRAEALYRRVTPEIHIAKGLLEAEAAKLLENTYRQVNLALVHEFAAFCTSRGIDVADTIDAAATKPFGFQPFHPGAGVGGHCIPVDPLYLAHAGRQSGAPMRLTELAQQINDGRPGQVVDQCGQLLASTGRQLRGARVLVLGLTYKPGVADVRNTPAAQLIRVLGRAGAVVEVHDPLVPGINVDGSWWASVADLEDSVHACDLVLLAQRHVQYRPEVLRRAPLLYVADYRGPGLG